MNHITNRQAICETLMEAAENDRTIVVACSDSRGSASLAPFAQAFPRQFIELGIAEQNLVSVSAGLASCGKKVFAASPASFLSTRSYEQVKVDVAYSGTNVTLIGISGGISYGALGMTHHSLQDIGAMACLPDMRVYVPSDRFQTARLIRELLKDEKPAYVRVSRSATEDIYGDDMDFTLNRAHVLAEGKDAVIITCGELVPYGVKAQKELERQGYDVGLIDMYCLKPIDEEAVKRAASQADVIITAEEHSPYGGLGSMVAQIVSRETKKMVVNLALPDGHLISGTNHEIFHYYGLDDLGMVAAVKKARSEG
ncbi:transketolase family protein [Lacrimispora xylanolytica]|uniref:Transketolase family protein n=1 Tax=Lacrimispora xylanolytica TaxID=29375 RepID=A0ABY7AAF3_9FIRM|nr:transketolase C-terminal domain-containing protein [Lacrimispora xylanolytica]WAJ23664.1 transketolase family protein [Lacrimispora xylanolytica]